MPALDDKKTEQRGRAVAVQLELNKEASAHKELPSLKLDPELFAKPVPKESKLIESKELKAKVSDMIFTQLGMTEKDRPALDKIHLFHLGETDAKGADIKFYITDKVKENAHDNPPIFYLARRSEEGKKGSALLALNDQFEGVIGLDEKREDKSVIKLTFSNNEKGFQVNGNYEQVINGERIDRASGKTYTKEELLQLGKQAEKDTPKKVGMLPAGMILQVAEASEDWKTPQAPQVAGKIRDLF